MSNARRWAAVAYRYLIALFALGVVVEFFLAGAGVFRAKGEPGKRLATSSTFDAHRGLGIVLGIAAVLLLLLALVHRPSWAWVGVNLAIALGVVVVQPLLAAAGKSAPWVAALHAVIGLAIMAIAGNLAGRAWRGARQEAPMPAPAAPR